MIEKAIDNYENVFVVQIERELASTGFEGYTFDLLQALGKDARYSIKNDELSFVIGADNAIGIMNGEWAKGSEILARYKLIVMGRGAATSNQFSNFPWYKGGMDIPEFSSTEIRTKLQKGDRSALDLVPESIQHLVERYYFKPTNGSESN